MDENSKEEIKKFMREDKDMMQMIKWKINWKNKSNSKKIKEDKRENGD